jgi:HEAT repeat protein
MAKNVVAKVIGLLEHERVELRAAAAMVLAEVGADEPDIEKGLVGRLADADAGVRRIALEGLAASGATGIAPKLVPLLRGDDEALATRAAQLLAGQGAAAEAALRKELASDAPLAARRVMAQLLIARGTTPALEAVLGQIAGGDFAEQALQLLRGELDGAGGGKLADAVEKLALAQLAEAGRALQKAWKAASKAAEASIAEAKAAAKGKGKGKVPAAAPAAPAIQDPLRDADVAAGVLEVGNLLRLIGYLARPSNLGLLLDFLDGERPRPVRLSAIAGLRRVVAKSEAKGTERAVETLIELCDGDDVVVAQAAVDTLRGARIPEKLAKPFAALAKSKNAAAQKLAMERLPAGGGAAAVKALVEALGRQPTSTARDAATRGLAKAPEAVLPVVRALVAMSASAPGGIDEGAGAGVTPAPCARTAATCPAPRPVELVVDYVRGHLEALLQGQGQRRVDGARAGRSAELHGRRGAGRATWSCCSSGRKPAAQEPASRSRRSAASSRCCAATPTWTPPSTTTSASCWRVLAVEAARRRAHPAHGRAATTRCWPSSPAWRSRGYPVAKKLAKRAGRVGRGDLRPRLSR